MCDSFRHQFPLCLFVLLLRPSCYTEDSGRGLTSRNVTVNLSHVTPHVTVSPTSPPSPLVLFGPSSLFIVSLWSSLVQVQSSSLLGKGNLLRSVRFDSPSTIQKEEKRSGGQWDST